MERRDRSYFQKRAEAERDAAQRADHPEAVQAHYLLAGFYLNLIHNDGSIQTTALTCTQACPSKRNHNHMEGGHAAGR